MARNLENLRQGRERENPLAREAIKKTDINMRQTKVNLVLGGGGIRRNENESLRENWNLWIFSGKKMEKEMKKRKEKNVQSSGKFSGWMRTFDTILWNMAEAIEDRKYTNLKIELYWNEKRDYNFTSDCLFSKGSTLPKRSLPFLNLPNL